MSIQPSGNISPTLISTTPMTQLEKAREEIRRNTLLTEREDITKRQIAFENRVAIYCEECGSTGKIMTPFGSMMPCFNCQSPDED